jgi:protease-4
MSLETDLLLDRRRLKRRLTFWRVAAVVAVVALGLVAADPHGVIARPHIARLRITGLITDDHKLLEQIDRAADDKNVEAMIVEVNSPGGGAGAGMMLHDAIARVAAHKPVVTVMESLAASAGYMVAVPAERIFASPGTITGSIGVLMEAPEISGLLGKIGVDTTTLVSGPLKDQPSLTHPLSPAGREVLQGIVGDLYDQFVDMVATGRHMDVAKVRSLADGRAYTGHQALALGLIDAYGTEADAKNWLEAQNKIARNLPVRDLHHTTLRERLMGPKGLSGIVADTLREAMTGVLTDENTGAAPMAVWSGH